MAKIIDITPKSRDIRPVLMLLTSHRLDCFLLCIKCLELYTDLSRFKKIYIVANDVTDEHAILIKRFQRRHGNVVDVHCTPRGILPAALAMENFILARHEDDPMIRLSEDVFVTPNWLEHMVAAYKLHRHLDDVPIVSALAPVSRTGRQIFNRIFREHYPVERQRLPNIPMEQNAVYHRFVWEKILHDDLIGKYFALDHHRHVYLGYVSVDCIMFDARLIKATVPFPLKPVEGAPRADEFHINGHLQTKGYRAVVASDALVHHFSYAGPEEYLRKHISIDDVWWHMTFLDETPSYERTRKMAALTGTTGSRDKLNELMRERKMRVLK